MFAAVLFDWDGTLADTRQAILLSFRKALEKVNVDVPDEFIERRVGIGAEETFREILRAGNTRFDDALIKSLVQGKIRSEISLSDHVTLLPGAVGLLKSLRGKVKLALASMNNKPVVDHLLGKMGLNGFFDVVLTVEEVTHFKPHPEIFLKCSSLLGESPEKCLVVEDSLFGVQAAKAAGMSCLTVLTGAYSETELAMAGSEMIVASLMDTKILRFILQ